jgi:Pilin accessory protein (PilO)
MRIVKIGPYTVVAGVEWVATQTSSAKEAITEAKLNVDDATLKHGIVVEGVDGYAVGFTQKAEKHTIGGAWLASSQKDDGDFVLVEPLDGGDFWLCAIKNGTPFYGSDLIGSAQTIEREARTLLESGGFRLVTSDENFGLALGELSTTFTAAGFEALIKGKGGFKTKPLDGDKRKLIYAVIVALILAGGYFGWTYYDEVIGQERVAAEVKAKKAQQQQKDAKLREAAQAEFNALKQKMISEELAKVSKELSTQGGDMPVLWSKVTGALHANTANWAYADGICDVKGCSFLLKPGVGATNKDLFKTFKTASLNEKGEAEIKYDMDAQALAVTTDQLRDKGAFVVDGLSLFQELKGSGLNVTWGQPENMMVKVPLPQILQQTTGMPPPAGAIAQPPMPGVQKIDESVHVGLTKGGFSVAGTSLWALEGVAKKLAVPEIVYNKLTLSFDTSGLIIKDWKLEGAFYAKP